MAFSFSLPSCSRMVGASIGVQVYSTGKAGPARSLWGQRVENNGAFGCQGKEGSKAVQITKGRRRHAVIIEIVREGMAPRCLFGGRGGGR